MIALSRIVFLALSIGPVSSLAQSPNAFGLPTVDKPQPTANIQAVSGTRAQGWPAQGRSEVLARHGIVATSDPLAAQAGLEILRRGGNAIDAAVATGAVLDVTSPNDTGIGGDLFALVYVAKDKKLYALSSAGWAPAQWTPEFFTERLGVRTMPGSGVNATTVPGAISGYDALLKRFGTMTFRQTFDRAAQIAEEGWPQAERRHADLLRVASVLSEDADSRAAFLPGDAVPPLYGIIRNAALGKALRLMQAKGRDAFYKGEIATAIIEKIRAKGGVMSAADLAEFQSERVEPVSTHYHGYDVFQLPPPGQGFAALEMLNILEVCVPKLGMSLAALGPSNPTYWHLLVESKKLAYADLLSRNADPKFVDVPVAQLLSKSHAASLCEKINPDFASATTEPAKPDGGTVYLTTADRWGNMVSLVHSVYSVYGSKVTVGKYGFVLQNRGAGFSLDPSSPNVVAPRKRPFHTIMAGFVMQGGLPRMAFGNMGGTVQPETHAQHMVNLIDLGMNVQMTSDAARFTHRQSDNVLGLEDNLFALVGASLQAMGHKVEAVNGAAVGGYQGILFTPQAPTEKQAAHTGRDETGRDETPIQGVYRAGSDHRKDGQAAGW